jgi:hypothetical protein
MRASHLRHWFFTERRLLLFHKKHNQSPKGVKAGEGNKAGAAYSCNTSTSLAGGRGIIPSISIEVIIVVCLLYWKRYQKPATKMAIACYRIYWNEYGRMHSFWMLKQVVHIITIPGESFKQTWGHKLEYVFVFIIHFWCSSFCQEWGRTNFEREDFDLWKGFTSML